MCFEILYVIFIVIAVLNYILLDIKVDKIKKESLDKDKVIGSLMAHNSALRRLNDGYKDHERRINDIESLLLSEKHEEPEEPEKPEEPKHTCKDCKYYRGLSDNVNYFNCRGLDDFFPNVCDMTCALFEKKEDLDEEDENVVYANNVKINITSKGPRVYMTDGIVTSEELADRIRKLYLDGGISYYDATTLLDRLNHVSMKMKWENLNND